jgi:hypothetical protein
LHAALFIIALGTIVVTAALVASALDLRSVLSFVLCLYVLGWSEVVAATELLSLVHAVGAWGYSIVEIVLLSASAVVWHARGRPRPPALIVDRAAARRHPFLVALALVVAAGFVYSFVVGITTAPNNGDTLTYHLSRAAGWLQQGGLQYLRGVHTFRENEFQINGEIGVLYTFALLGRDAAATLPQLLASGALALAVAGSARRLGFSRPAATFAGLLVPTLSNVVLQSVQPKNDLVVASFVAAAAYFVRSTRRAEIVLAGLSVGLAVGTKLTAWPALPMLLLLALVSLPRRRLAFAAGAAAAGVLAVGAYGYVQNTAETGSPFGVSSDLASYRPSAITVPGTTSVLARMVYRFIDFSGYRIRTVWLEPIEDAGQGTFHALGIPPNPPESEGFPFTFTVNVIADVDRSFFGPLGILLIVPLSLAYLVAWAARRTTSARGVHALALPLYALFVSLTFRFSDEPRYLLVAVALTMPLAAVLYSRRPVAAVVAGLAALTLVFADAYNVTKPSGLGGARSVWSLSRAEEEGLEVPGTGALIAALDRSVPARARIGTVLAPSDFDYPLYGPSLKRTLVPLPASRPIGAANRDELDFVFLGHGRAVPRSAVWRPVFHNRRGTILARSSG